MKHLPILIVAIALLLRLPGLNDSFWLDEAAQALEVTRPLSQQLQIVDDFQPPLLHLLLHAFQYINRSEWWLRLWGALIPGLLTVLLTYKIGKEHFSKTVGAVAALLLATSSLHVFYSQELRPYALPAFFATYTWFLLLKNQSLNKKQQASWILATAAGLFSTYLYPFVVLGQGLFLFFKDIEQKKQYFISLMMSFLLFLPWLPSFLDQLNAGQKLRQDLPGWEFVVSTPQLKALPLVLGKFIYGVLEIDFNLLYLLPILIIFVGFGLNLKRVYEKNKTAITGILLWTAGSILIAWIISFWVPVILPKRVIFALPGFYLLLAAAFCSAFIKFKIKNLDLQKTIALISLLVLITVNLFSLFSYYTKPELRRENWRDLVTTIEQKYPKERSIALFSFPEPFAPFRWYASDYPSLATQSLSLDQVKDLPGLLRPIVDYEFVLVFDYLRDLTDPSDKLTQTVESFDFKQVDHLDYPNIGFVRVYSRAESLTAYENRN